MPDFSPGLPTEPFPLPCDFCGPGDFGNRGQGPFACVGEICEFLPGNINPKTGLPFPPDSPQPFSPGGSGFAPPTLPQPIQDIPLGSEPIPETPIDEPVLDPEGISLPEGVGVAEAETAGVAFGTLVGLGIEALIGMIIPGSAPLEQEHAPTEPEATPSPPLIPPPLGTVLAEGEFLPPNWWEIASAGDVFAGDPSVQSPFRISPRLVGALGETLRRLLDPGQLGDIDATPSPDLSAQGLLDPLAGDLPTITVTGTAPAPVGIAAALADPVLAPLPFSEFGLAPSVAAALATPDLETALDLAPAFGDVAQSTVGTTGGLAAPFLDNPLATGRARARGRLRSGSFTPTPSYATTPEALAQFQPAPATRQDQCVRTRDQQKRKKRKGRKVCHEGIYDETKKGLIKHPRRVIECR